MAGSVRKVSGLLLFVVSVVGAAPLQRGAARADVVSALGEPGGAIVAGPREVLSYPEGKVVLEHNKLTSASFDLDEAAQTRAEKVNTEPPAPLPPNVRKAQGAITVTRGKELSWFSDLEEAKAEAASHYKPLLVLYTGEPAEAWNSVFTRTIVYNTALLHELQDDFVLLKLTFPSASAVDSGNAEPAKLRALEEFRKRTIGGTRFPALAIVTADGRRAVEVNLDDAENAQGRMAAYVKDAIAAAKEQPLRARGGVSGTFVFGAVAGLLVLVWLLKH